MGGGIFFKPHSEPCPPPYYVSVQLGEHWVITDNWPTSSAGTEQEDWTPGNKQWNQDVSVGNLSVGKLSVGKLSVGNLS